MSDFDRVQGTADATEADGSESFEDPRFYPGFVEQLRDLIGMITADLEADHSGDCGSDNGL